MNAGQTFHTPSFGDEEFEIPAATSGQVFTLGEQPQTATQAAANYSTGLYYTDAVMGDKSDDSINLDLKRKKETLVEPQKPVSAYALFFRDTQAAIKGQNPDASFEEVSKIVTSMWDALDPGHKNVYKKKAEAAKREYMKALAAYRASLNASTEDVAMSNLSENGDVSLEKSTAAVSPKHATTKAVSTANLIRVAQPQDNVGNLHQDVENKSENSNLSMHAVGSISNPTQAQSTTDQNENTTTDSAALQRCIREGCTNLAVINADWEDEYCSNECVITHCRNVFAQWVQANSLQPETYTS